MTPAMPLRAVAANRCLSKQPSASEPPRSASVGGAPFIIRNEVSGSGTAACGTSKRFKRLMPESTLNKSRRSSAATAATARPTANTKREVVPGYTTARPSAARHKAVVGFTVAKPEPQLDSKGTDTHQLINAAAAIVTAAKPAA